MRGGGGLARAPQTPPPPPQYSPSECSKKHFSTTMRQLGPLAQSARLLLPYGLWSPVTSPGSLAQRFRIPGALVEGF